MSGTTYIVTVKLGAPIEPAVEFAKSQGGTIANGDVWHTSGSFRVTFPKDAVTILEGNENVESVESEGMVHTQ